MAEFSLISEPPLAGVEFEFGGIKVHAPENLAIVSIALPLGGEADAEKAINAAFGEALPDPGRSVVCKDGSRLVRLSPDQAFVMFTHETPDAEPFIEQRLKGKAYTTDQTDVWVGLVVEGSQSRAALERICPIDLHDAAFAIDDAARTVMEHLGVLIIRTGANAFLLLSASSSADSFLHAIQLSARNVS
ncbi:MAG: sarcosine oxidase subunit gamma [Pseudomonadota bacterium]